MTSDSERNIRVTVAYDGTAFCGWQVQNDQRTVQGVMEEALGRMHKHPVKVIGSGRTDSGVHALGQVANFRSDIASIDPAKYAEALNSFLPPDVQVIRSETVTDDFHARFDARRRTYRYYVLSAPVTLPWQRNYCWRIRRRPDINRLNRMAASLVGEHDFSSFSTPEEERKSAVRLMYSSGFFYMDGFLVYQISGNGFLWKMVRSVMGTLMELESAGGDRGDVEKILAARDRREAGPTAPAHGLFLYHVGYGDA